AAGRLLNEQAALDSSLAGIGGELAGVVTACIRTLIGGGGEAELARAYIANALRRMRQQKRVRLRVSPDRYAFIRDAVRSIVRDFPESELIDGTEDRMIESLGCGKESESGRNEGSVERNLREIEERLRGAIPMHRHASVAGSGRAGVEPDARRESGGRT